jgi:SpoVK/Ycf46/Vps4 family AAA+-type ATPase
METKREWDDLVLPGETRAQVGDLLAWLEHGETMMHEWGMASVLKPGYRALFYGPPGTGKTFTAVLLGKRTDRPVYRIDLSMVVSKFIGETEKNLSNLFDRADNKDWILFFDEADALFGKRTNVRDAHDRYANQEVSYLLQRLEDYSGLAILAINLRQNIDEAFMRRFNAIIDFPMPDVPEREVLWEKTMPEQLGFCDDLTIARIARKYELTGASIANVVQHCALRALQTRKRVLDEDDLDQAVRREFDRIGEG